jgi:hypothetical protein
MPPSIDGFSCNFFAFRQRYALPTSRATFFTAKLSERDSGGIPAILYAVLDLTRGNVANKLGKLDRIAWALLAGFGHDDIIAWLATEGIGPSTASEIKLTHYPPLITPDSASTAISIAKRALLMIEPVTMASRGFHAMP